LTTCEKRKHCKGIKGVVFESPIRTVEKNGSYFASKIQTTGTYSNASFYGPLVIYNDSLSFYSDFNANSGNTPVDFKNSTVLIMDFNECSDKKKGIKFEILSSMLRITRCGISSGVEGCGPIFNRHKSWPDAINYFIITDKLKTSDISYGMKNY
jgi:hypothetical protein